MNDKVLQAVIKLKDEISKPLKSVKSNMETLNKSTAEAKKKLSDFEGGMKQVGKGCAVAGAAITGAIGAIFAARSKVGMEFEAPWDIGFSGCRIWMPRSFLPRRRILTF